MKESESVTQSCLTLCNPMDCSHQAPLPIRFFRQEYWSKLPFLPPGDLPDLGMEPGSPTLQADSLPAEPAGKPFLSFPFIEKVFGAMYFTLVTSFNEAYSFWYLVFSLLWSLKHSKDSVCIFVFNQSCLIQCAISVSRRKHIFPEVVSGFISLWSENEEELKSLLMKSERGEWKSWLKTQPSKN